jgi:hypothetical protein
MFVLHKLLIGRSFRGICMMDSEIHTEILLGKTKVRRTLRNIHVDGIW